MTLTRWALLVAAAPLAASCGNFGKAMTAHTDVVARAAGKELKVDEAAEILAGVPGLPVAPEHVASLAQLWTDYALLATAAAEDSTLAVLNLDELVAPEVERKTIGALLEASAKPDTTFTDAELEQLWNSEGPGQEVKARHVLLRYPGDATPAQRDSVKKLAEQIRGRAAGGEDFANLARQYSSDGSAQQGGDLGWFSRNRMVPAFEQAAFALQPGQVSPVVESPFGLHVIKVDDRRQQPMGAQKDEFRRYLVQSAGQRAVTTFIDSLGKAAQIKPETGAAAAFKELAEQPGLEVSGRAAERVLVRYRGGEVTAGELAERLRMEGGPNVREQVKTAPDEQLTGFLEDIARQEVLTAEARRRNLQPSAASVDSLRTQARTALRQIVQATGLGGRVPRGSAGNEAIEAKVKQLIQEMVAGQRGLQPLGTLGAALKKSYGAEVFEASYDRVVTKVQQIRATQPQPAPQQPQGGPAGPQGQPAQPAPQPQAAPAQPRQ
jgi:hypothetical protein